MGATFATVGTNGCVGDQSSTTRHTHVDGTVSLQWRAQATPRAVQATGRLCTRLVEASASGCIAVAVGSAAVATALPYAAQASHRQRKNRRAPRPVVRSVACDAASLGEIFEVEPLDVDPEGGSNGEAVAVWLHGLGDTGRGWSSTAPALQRMGLPMLRFIFPTAPIRDTNTGSRGPCPSWYDVGSLDPDEIARLQESPAGLVETAESVLDLVEPYVRRGVHPSRIFFIGYSQGGGVALAAALRAPRPVGGVLLLSSWVPEPVAPGNSSVPVHVLHGVEDPVIPAAVAKRGSDMLQAAGFRTSFRAYPQMTHGVCDEEVGDIARILYEALH